MSSLDRAEREEHLLRSLNRMIEPTNGKIQFKGSETMGIKGKKLRELRRHMGMIFQGYNLVTRVSVLNNVLHGRLGYMNPLKGALGLYSKADTEAAKFMLHRVGLHEQMYKRAVNSVEVSSREWVLHVHFLKSRI